MQSQNAILSLTHFFKKRKPYFPAEASTQHCLKRINMVREGNREISAAVYRALATYGRQKCGVWPCSSQMTKTATAAISASRFTAKKQRTRRTKTGR
jgi:hypothetical protein